MGGYYCCVPLCGSQSGKSFRKLSWHSFPADSERRNLWVKAVRRDIGKKFKITGNTKVCSLHFLPTDYRPLLHTSKNCLKPNAVPSVFVFGPQDDLEALQRKYKEEKRKKKTRYRKSQSVGLSANTKGRHARDCTKLRGRRKPHSRRGSIRDPIQKEMLRENLHFFSVEDSTLFNHSHKRKVRRERRPPQWNLDRRNFSHVICSSAQKGGRKIRRYAQEAQMTSTGGEYEDSNMLEPGNLQFLTKISHETENHFPESSVFDISASVLWKAKLLGNDTVEDSTNFPADYELKMSSKRVCPVCLKVYPSQLQLEIHLAKYLGEEIYRCMECEDVFTSVRDFQAHMLLHTEVKDHQCPNCDEKYTPPPDSTTKHNAKKCRLCFSTSQSIQTQVDDNPNIKFHVCQICSKVYLYRSYLRRHLKNHTHDVAHLLEDSRYFNRSIRKLSSDTV